MLHLIKSHSVIGGVLTAVATFMGTNAQVAVADDSAGGTLCRSIGCEGGEQLCAEIKGTLSGGVIITGGGEVTFYCYQKVGS